MAPDSKWDHISVYALSALIVTLLMVLILVYMLVKRTPMSHRTSTSTALVWYVCTYESRKHARLFDLCFNINT